MSQFYSERSSSIPVIPPAPGPADEQTRNAVKTAFSAFNLVPEAWLSGLISYVEANQPMIPLSNIFGYRGSTALTAPTIQTSESTASTSYVDLATVGPQLTGLGGGVYAIWYGASVGGAGTTYANVSANGATPANDNDAIGATGIGANSLPISRAIFIDLPLESANSLKMVYRVTSGTGTYEKRWMLALRTGT